ncbi:MAG: SPFH domain-containing protein [Deltaproteobacteria bacterium]|nr:SPFH domain-containing protein [Deltaproteobacteria bacterium]
MDIAINLTIWGLFSLYLVYKLIRSIRFVPNRYEYIVERLGKYRKTLGAGPHLLLPFFDKVSFIRDLKEQTIAVPPQECFTEDNVKVHVDGVMYISVNDSVKASYGVTDYIFAASQLAQTTTRSIIGTLTLDQTFEERDLISVGVVKALTEAGHSWGITVHRYEVKNIVTPETVRNAMEQQVTAERERRATVARAEGEKQTRINRSEGEKAQAVNKSEGEMQRRINEAQGRAEAILSIASATAESIEKIAAVVSLPGGVKAVRLQMLEKYVDQLSNLARPDTRVLLPADLTKPDALYAALGLSEDDLK